jgi:Protein of unknown function (DUF3433)
MHMKISTQGTLEVLAITHSEPEAPCQPPQTITSNFQTSTIPGTCVPLAPESQYWLAVGTVTLLSQPIPTLGNFTKPLVYVFTEGQYFVGAFLPTLIAVLFSLPWIIIDPKVRTLEPFHQLSANRGASASTSLYMDYISPFILIIPFKALLARHWAPFMTSLISISTILLTPLAPEFLSIRMQGSCNFETTGCVPSLSIFPAAGRAIQALLSLIALLTVFLVIQMYHYSTGVFAESSSIAGITTLFHNTDVAEDFRTLSITANTTSKGSTFTPLRMRRYKIDFYSAPDGSQKYGFIPLVSFAHLGANVHAEQHDATLSSREQDLPFSRPLWGSSLGLMILLLALLTIIIYYKLTDTLDPFERFMDSQGFGVRFLFTSIGVIVKLYWQSIFRSMFLLLFS